MNELMGAGHRARIAELLRRAESARRRPAPDPSAELPPALRRPALAYRFAPRAGGERAPRPATLPPTWRNESGCVDCPESASAA